MGWKETFTTACWVRVYHLRQFMRIFFRYYLWHPKFFLADMMLLSQYFFKSPYRIVRDYDEEHPGHPLGPYGETDFRLMARLLDRFSISHAASIADLGAGRGRLAFFLRCVRGHKKVLAVELHPLMVERAERVRRALHIRHLSFVHGSWANIPLEGIDVVYVYGIVIDKEASMALARHLALLPQGTKIITISSWLGETIPDSFRLETTLSVSFEWGETEAFLQTVVWR